jgi:hypothetical protein
MKPLVVVRTAIQTVGVLAGAYLVFTGLANLPRLFSGSPSSLRASGWGASSTSS